MPTPRPTLWPLTRLTFTPLLLSACIVFSGPGDQDQDVRDLVAARARWNSNGVSNYVVTARTLCFCVLGGQPVRVSVRNGAVTSVVVIATGQPVDAALTSVYRPIESLFDVLEDAVQRRAHRIEVTYDKQYGYPTRFFIDYLENAADEEFGYEIDTFTPSAP